MEWEGANSRANPSFIPPSAFSSLLLSAFEEKSQGIWRAEQSLLFMTSF